jgi:cell division protein FtsW
MNGLYKTVIILVVAFMMLGAIIVFTASGTYSDQRFESIYHMFAQHLWKVIAAGFCIWLFSLIPNELYKQHSKKLIFAIIGVLILTLFFAPKVKGATRFIDLGVIQFQPSELAKLILIIHLANMVEKLGDKISDFKNGFMFALIWIVLISGLVLIQPNVSTSFIIAITGFTVLYVGGVKFKHIFFTFLTAGGVIGTVMMAFPHSRQRIFTFMNSVITGEEINKQVMQAKIALGSGGWFGVGLGESRQSDLFLPESYGDFIFSILGEELGFAGTVSVLFFYLALFIICLIIAKKIKGKNEFQITGHQKFGQLLVFGLAFNILLSGFINAGVVTGLLPTTGITLPFISFGGTSILLFGVSIGIIVNVAKQTLKTENSKMAQLG